jgi:ferredoxin-NADP reductase
VTEASLRWQEAELLEVAPLTASLRSYRLRPSQPFAFVAGQHVDVRLTAEDGYQAQRSYSIASAPEAGPELELAIERLPDGEVSGFFHEVAAPGDRIELRGPIGGHFVWSAADGGPLLLIGGGSGVVPLVSMLRHRAYASAPPPAVLLLSAASWSELPYRDALLALEARADGLACVFALTRDEPTRAGDFGRRVDRALLEAVLARAPSAPQHVFVCGSNGFVEAASQGLLDAGVAGGRIRTERYG